MGDSDELFVLDGPSSSDDDSASASASQSRFVVVFRQGRMGNDVSIETYRFDTDNYPHLIASDSDAFGLRRLLHSRRAYAPPCNAIEFQRQHPPPQDPNFLRSDVHRQIVHDIGGDAARLSLASAIRRRQTVASRAAPTLRTNLASRMVPNTSSVLSHEASRIYIGRFSQKGEVFASCNQDGVINLYRVEGRTLKHDRKIEGRSIGWSIIDFAFSPDERYAVYSSWSDCLHMVNIPRVETPTGHLHDVHVALDMSPDFGDNFCAFSLQFSSDNTQIMAGCNRGSIYIYDRLRAARTLGFFGHDKDVNSTCFADDSSMLLFSGSDDCTVKVWDRRALSEEDPVPVAKFAGHFGGITSVASKGDGRHLISNSKDHSIKLWDIRKPTSPGVVGRATRFQRDPRDPYVNVEGDTSVVTYCGHSTRHTLVQCHFSPLETTGQRYIYTGSCLGSCVIYDALTGKVVSELCGHSSVVRDVSWHPRHPDMLATSSWDGRVRIWERSGKAQSTDAEDDEELCSDDSL